MHIGGIVHRGGVQIGNHANAQAFQFRRQMRQGNAVFGDGGDFGALHQTIGTDQQAQQCHGAGVAWCQHGLHARGAVRQPQQQGQQIAQQRPDQSHAHGGKQTAADQLRMRNQVVGHGRGAHEQNQQCRRNHQQSGDAQAPPECPALRAPQGIPQPQCQQGGGQCNQRNHNSAGGVCRAPQGDWHE